MSILMDCLEVGLKEEYFNGLHGVWFQVRGFVMDCKEAGLK